MDPWLASGLGFAAALLPAALGLYALDRRYRRERAARRTAEAEADAARALVATLPGGFLSWDASGETPCSPRLAAALGLPRAPASAAAILGALAPDSRAALTDGLRMLREGGRPLAFDVALSDGRRTRALGRRLAFADGRWLGDFVWIDEPAAPVRPAVPDAAALRAAFAGIEAPVWLCGPDGTLLAASAAGAPLAATADATALAARVRAGGDAAAGLVAAPGGIGALTLVEMPVDGAGTTVGFAFPAADDGPAADLEDAAAPLAAAIAVFDGEARLDFANPAFAALWGLDSQWLAQRPNMTAVLDRLRELRRLPEVTDFRAWRDGMSAKCGGLAAAEETLLHLPGGATVRSVIAPRRRGGLVLAYEDVSERYTLERSLRSLAAVQRQTIDHLAEGLAVIGSDGRLRLANPNLARLWSLDPAAVAPGIHATDLLDRLRPLLDGADWPAERERLRGWLMARSGGAQRFALADGRVLDGAVAPLPDGGTLATFVDVTDGVRAERAMAERTLALQEASRTKSAFIASVSFEVRTPLTALLGFAELLANGAFGPLNARQGDYAGAILDSGRRLGHLIANVLDLAAIDAGTAHLELEPVDVHSALAEAFAMVRERAQAKALDLAFDCPLDVGWVIADGRRLKQAVYHLLANAVAATPQGGRARLAARREADGVAIVVADGGPGVTVGDPERALRRFEDGPQERADGVGPGFGLALAKRFVDLHGGRVEFEARAGKGTAVRCHLPLDPLPLSALDRASGAPAADRANDPAAA